MGMPHNVTFQLGLENYTNEHLKVYQGKIVRGHIVNPATDISPAKKEAMCGHKVSDTATGCVGTIAWKIGETGKMVVVMYSVPYDQNIHSNWCGVGIFDVTDTSDFFDIMYYGEEVKFRRKDFY